MSDEKIIAPGTPCYLVGLVEMPWANGRVVTVRGAATTVADEPGDWFAVAAPWISEIFPGKGMETLRRNLLPIPDIDMAVRTPPAGLTREQWMEWRAAEDERMYAGLKVLLVAWLEQFTEDELAQCDASFEQCISFEVIEPTSPARRGTDGEAG